LLDKFVRNLLQWNTKKGGDGCLRVFEPGKIVARRKQLSLTQTALAERAGIARGYLNEIEAGKCTPTASIIAKIAPVLKVKESYFFINVVR
jgi:transcriptional regulator with XRE-family HTH domain